MPCGLDGNLTWDYGFLPPRLHVTPLPDPFSVWEETAERLSDLVFNDAAQSVLERMPVLPSDPSNLPEEHVKRAAIVLGLLACAYWRFGIDNFYLTRNSDISDHLPDCILKPWKEVSRRLGRQRHYQSTEDLLLNNFTLVDETKISANGEYRLEEVSVEAIKNLIPVFNNEAERVFYSAIVEVHAVSAPVIKDICLIQSSILTHGPDASDDVAASLARISDCVEKATRTLRKITAQQKSKTYCDPILWSKTIAIFNVPPLTYPLGPMSGSASPFIHVMDALIGRIQFTSEYGKFSKKIHDHYLTNKLGGFLATMREVDVKEYIVKMRGKEPARFQKLASAFDDLIDSYTGPRGFLGVHVSKVFHYLNIGTLEVYSKLFVDQGC